MLCHHGHRSRTLSLFLHLVWYLSYTESHDHLVLEITFLIQQLVYNRTFCIFPHVSLLCSWLTLKVTHRCGVKKYVDRLDWIWYRSMVGLRRVHQKWVWCCLVPPWCNCKFPLIGQLFQAEVERRMSKHGATIRQWSWSECLPYGIIEVFVQNSLFTYMYISIVLCHNPHCFILFTCSTIKLIFSYYGKILLWSDAVTLVFGNVCKLVPWRVILSNSAWSLRHCHWEKSVYD